MKAGPGFLALAMLALSSVGSLGLTSSSTTDVAVPEDAGKAHMLDRIDGSAIWAEPPPSAAPLVTAPAVPAPAPPPILSDNPLWAVPLATLKATRDRPIFSPSRRPPASPVAPVAAQRVAPPPKPKEPDRPPLSLVGTIASANEGFGIFLDAVTKTALRLKLGEAYQGWTLRSVRGREVVLEKDEAATTLAMPKPGEERTSGGAEPANGLKRSARQSTGRSDR
jgi:hypothetical protein